MLTFFNRILHPKRKSEASRPCGQVAIVLIIIIAILFIFFAVILNLGKISQTKTLTTIATNVSTSFMASGMASYTEYLYQMQLGGEDKADDDLTVCGWTGVAAAIISVVLVALSFLLPGTTALVVSIIAAILSVAAVAIQILVIQPEITKLWEKQMASMEVPDGFVERGIRAALQYSIDDNVLVPDANDIDIDNYFDGNSQDKVSRFSVLYNKRLDKLSEARRVNPALLVDFLNVLGDFIHRNPYIGTKLSGSATCPITLPGDCVLNDNWGMWDSSVWDSCGTASQHACCTSSHPTPECNPCCLPVQNALGQSLDRFGNVILDRNGNIFPGENPFEPNLRPSCCDSVDPAVPSCGTVSTCPNQGYWPWIFDPLYENPSNGLVSLREYLGTDDENRFLFARIPPSSGAIWDVNTYRSFNTSGTVFPLLWKLSQVGILDPTTIPIPRPTCFWCDSRRGITGPPTCRDEDFGWGVNLGAPWPVRQPLPDNCSGYGCCVGAVVGNFDRVVVPGLLVSPNACATENPPMWKKGSDRYCSKRWPYNDACPGEQCGGPPLPPGAPGCGQCSYCDDTLITACPVNTQDDCQINDNAACTASQPETPNWVGDSVDALRYEMDDFIKWADATLKTDTSTLSAEFMSWFPQVEEWVRKLGDWRTGNIQRLLTVIGNWRNGTYVGGACSDQCFPGPGCPGYVANATIPAIINCLDQKRVYYENILTTYNNLVAQLADLNTQLAALNAQLQAIDSHLPYYNDCLVRCRDYEQNTVLRMQTSWSTCQYNCRSESTNWTEGCWKTAVSTARLNYWECWTGCYSWSPPAPAGCYTQPNGIPAAPYCDPGGGIFVPVSQLVCGPSRTTDYFVNWVVSEQTRLTQEAADIRLQITNLQSQAADVQSQINTMASQIPVARNLAEEFRRRRDFLQSAYNDAAAVSSVLSTASTRINAFITSARLTALRNEWTAINNDINNNQVLANHVVYGWKDDKNSCIDNTGNRRGCWHVVRVDTRMPGRCNNRCGRNGAIEPIWPWVKTWTKGSGTRRCYALGDSFDRVGDCNEKDEYDDDVHCFKGGTIKSRVVRFDENKASTFSFANAVPIWRFMYHHPGTAVMSPDWVDQMAAHCDVGNLDTPGAFMINEISAAQETNPGPDSCYRFVKPLLQQGVMSQTCAEYFFHDRSARGFNTKFVKCAGTF